MGLSGRSNSDAEILRVGVLGAGLEAGAGEGQRLSCRLMAGGWMAEAAVQGSMEDWWRRCGGVFSLVEGWMAWTRSANQAFTISLWAGRRNISLYDAEVCRCRTKRFHTYAKLVKGESPGRGKNQVTVKSSNTCDWFGKRI